MVGDNVELDLLSIVDEFLGDNEAVVDSLKMVGGNVEGKFRIVALGESSEGKYGVVGLNVWVGPKSVAEGVGKPVIVGKDARVGALDIVGCSNAMSELVVSFVEIIEEKMVGGNVEGKFRIVGDGV